MTATHVHHTVTSDRVVETLAAAERTLDNPGICLACGEDAEGCEPDARNYKCEACGARQVFGLEEILLEMMFAGHPLTNPPVRGNPP